MTPTSILIFAAGLGTRMGALTADRPKPLISVAGRALIDHALDQTRPVMPLTRVVNLHWKAEQLRAHLAGQDIRFSDETDLLRETGGGLAHALPLLGAGPVFTLNSDAVWTGPNALAQLRAAWRPEVMDALLLLIPPARARGHRGAGDFVPDADGRLHRGPGLIYSGAQIIDPKGISAMTEPVFSLNRLWDRMIAGGRLFGIEHAGHWCDVGRPEAIALAEDLLNEARDAS